MHICLSLKFMCKLDSGYMVKLHILYFDILLINTVTKSFCRQKLKVTVYTLYSYFFHYIDYIVTTLKPVLFSNYKEMASNTFNF